MIQPCACAGMTKEKIMIYKIKLRMANVKNKANDPWELHFNIENEDDDIISRLKKDFTFEVGSSWIVSAYRPEPMIGIYNLKWYIRGSLEHIEGNKKYYNIAANAVFNKHEFNNKIDGEYSEIRNKFYNGQFDSVTGIMKILDN